MRKKEISLQGRRETEYTLADLMERCGFTVQKVSEYMNVETHVVMEWVCGRVPSPAECIELSLIMNCPLSKVYEAILGTPCVLYPSI